MAGVFQLDYSRKARSASEFRLRTFNFTQRKSESRLGRKIGHFTPICKFVGFRKFFRRVASHAVLLSTCKMLPKEVLKSVDYHK